MNIKQRALGSFIVFITLFCALSVPEVNATSTDWRVASKPRFTQSFALTLQLSEIEARTGAAELDQTYLFAARELWQQDALGLAVALTKTNENQQAVGLINNVLSASPSAETLAQAQLIHSWILQNEYVPKIRALINESKFAEAFALVDDFHNHSIDESALQVADAMRSLVEGTQRVQLIEIALLKSTTHQNLPRRKK